ncbi:MAG TPA: SbcC/MukB-like Walker B domain-containing protein [Edaphobacter sp.]|uniref:ATP-binding protein n=1 Tax=Edaphobacter sp. TaxID=1934404 RepID=UPI002BD1F1BA|nr:SbcC/MukB-like Walker B domain-containing protein [Edaphobacter sp.]HUZ94370.1 SbcC/MukB-like Walker B domain-containing protein [Edaphobacter sp.]
MAVDIPELFVPEQFRASRLQVFNWGTFSGLHDIPLSDRGFLIVGKSGTGKSTLLDAFSALLVPPRWVDFNAAARETERSGRDRNLLSYMRGAWAEKKDGDSGQIATRYLRTGTTWSALALTFRSRAAKIVTLVRLFWIRGTSSSVQDVRRYFLIFEREVDLRELEDFGANLDVRKLKHGHADAFVREDFQPYQERFCRLLGIENEAALRLLHKTQSAKNLGDLNTFLRDFMLDRPQTFDVAEQLVSEFGELNAAHTAVVTAREQVQTLKPAREDFDRMQLRIQARDALAELQARLRDYVDICRLKLLREQLDELDTQAAGIEGELEKNQASLDSRKAVLHDLEQQHREAGGDMVERWESEKKELESQRAHRLRKNDQARNACRSLGWILPDSPQEFAGLLAKAREEIESWADNSAQSRKDQVELEVRKREAESAFVEARREVEALRRQPSNIPAGMLELRRRVAEGAGVPEAALPFAGELIQVKQDQREWLQTSERVLRNFAVSLLADERNYPAVATYINGTDLGQRLFYYRTLMAENPSLKPVPANCLALKLEVKQCIQREWLVAELRSRFDYACVNTLAEFRRVDRAVTREGQIKHSKTRHEKDDRRSGTLQRMLGFDNREKREEFERHTGELGQQLAEVMEKIRKLEADEQARAERRMQCQTLVNLQWQEIDAQSIVRRIAEIDQNLRSLKEGNGELRRIGEQLERQRALVEQADQELRNSLLRQQQNLAAIGETRGRIAKIAARPPVTLDRTLADEFDRRFSRVAQRIRLAELDSISVSVLQGMHRESAEVSREISAIERAIESRFQQFVTRWPAESGDLQPNMSSSGDFFAKLTRLEVDGLPAHEHRFFDLLRNQSLQNLASLSTHLNNARKEILGRMDVVNASLRNVPFNRTAEQTTYLQIEASDKQLAVVREFKQEVQQALSHAWTDDRDDAERRFLVLRRIVDRLSSQAIEDKHWRELVLDVRQHVEFIGREFDEEHVEVEVYRSGAGKSGGQRQKLATTCLAAALRYQLGGVDHGIPRYATVVLDEAFDKADNEFTALAMNIFASFGFQMIVATPLKSVMTLEPFIGGACFVDISERRTSGVMMIDYELDRQRLKLPEHARQEVDA